MNGAIVAELVRRTHPAMVAPPEITRVLAGETYTVSVRQLGDEGQGFVRQVATRAGFIIKMGSESVFVSDRDLMTATEQHEAE